MLHADIAEKWHVSIEMVQGINTGRYWKMDREYPIQNRTRKQEPKTYYCIDCGVEITKDAVRCIACSRLYSRKYKERPTANELQKELFEANGNFTVIGKRYGVTDNAIRKWCKQYNIPYHSSDYKIQ